MIFPHSKDKTLILIQQALLPQRTICGGDAIAAYCDGINSIPNSLIRLEWRPPDSKRQRAAGFNQVFEMQ